MNKRREVEQNKRFPIFKQSNETIEFNVILNPTLFFDEEYLIIK